MTNLTLDIAASEAAVTTAQPESPATTRKTTASATAAESKPNESRGSIVSKFLRANSRSKETKTIVVLAVAAIALTILLLAWGNPMPVGSRGFWLIAKLRVTNILIIALVSFAQASATVAFQTVTGNRILTPSIMGFEALYKVVQTSAIFFFGIAGLDYLIGLPSFLLQTCLMVGLAVLLYGWLLSDRFGDLPTMLLIGIVIGGGLGSIATFMQRLLSPSEFDVLTARMFGSLTNAQTEYLPVSYLICAVAGYALWRKTRKLDVMALGKDVSTNLGIRHRRETLEVLLLTAVLMSVSTALIGPLTFFGFLVATLSYQFAKNEHRHILPIATLIGYVTLTGAYFLMQHVFYAQGVVGIIIELFGGAVFLLVLLRKGRL